MRLKSCPFCGSKLELTGPWYSEYENKWYLRCWGRDNEKHNMIEFSEPNKSVYSDDSTHKKEKKLALKRLIDKWNTRHRG
jgi:hypothetical protein